jgi:hypothetical protein
MWIACIKTPFGITNQATMIQVKVTVAKKLIKFPSNNLSCAYWQHILRVDSLYQDATQ